MAEIALKGNMKVKTLKAEFKKAFGSTLRVYKSASCKGAFADDDATLASIRAEGAKPGELSVKGNMHVGNFEKKVAEMYGIGVQVADADDTRLVNNDLTLASLCNQQASTNSKKNEAEEPCQITEVVETSPYSDILTAMNKYDLVYIPTYEVNEDGVSLDVVDTEYPEDAYNQINSALGDWENGEISCAISCKFVDLQQDGVYFTKHEDYSTCCGKYAIAVLNGNIITALFKEDGGEFYKMRIEKEEFSTEDF
jgi:hypothetical protein